MTKPNDNDAREKGRLVSQTAFPVLRQPHISGRFQNLCTRGLFPGRVLLGDRCKSGQSRLDPDTDAMVSHLRKMSPLSREHAYGTRPQRWLYPLIPLSTGEAVQSRNMCAAQCRASARRALAGLRQLRNDNAVHDQIHRHQHGRNQRPWQHLHRLRAFAGVNDLQR